MRQKFGGHVESGARSKKSASLAGSIFMPRFRIEDRIGSWPNCRTTHRCRAPRRQTRRPLRDGDFRRCRRSDGAHVDSGALYNLARARLLSNEFAVLGRSPHPMTDEDFRKRILEDDQAVLRRLRDRRDCGIVFRDASIISRAISTTTTSFPSLRNRLAQIDRDHGTHQNVFYYLATAPELFRKDRRKTRQQRPDGANRDHWRRVIIEKPFGHDLESAKALNQQLLKVADEKQIYRIDHYLGKETVQNILAFRFANGIFEPIWNRRYIDHVQISVAETVGVESRGRYFDHAGSLRDMVPNHIMQLITLTAMEPPISFDAIRCATNKRRSCMPFSRSAKKRF